MAKEGQFWGLGIQKMGNFTHKNANRLEWVDWITCLRPEFHFFNKMIN